jgi:hypothetical protein
VRTVVQKAVIQVITPQIVRYTCDFCGAVCGTRANPKETWHGSGRTWHYCKKTQCKEKERQEKGLRP